MTWKRLLQHKYLCCSLKSNILLYHYTQLKLKHPPIYMKGYSDRMVIGFIPTCAISS